MADLLLSQRIAKDIKFLIKLKDDNRSVSDIRMKVIKAYKLLVPKEMFNLLDFKNVNTSIDIIADPKAYTKRIRLHQQFSKLPFKVIFIENETGGFLCEELDDGFEITIFDDECHLYHTSIVSTKIKSLTDFGIRHVKHTKHQDDIADVYESFFSSLMVKEILLFLNTKNVTKHLYSPNKKENSSVPKPLLPFYFYHVLDIFREKKVFNGLENIKGFINSDKTNTIERRACIVRGHFKNRSTGIFWWSDFVRNKKNIDKGYVDKDYRLNV